MRVIHITTVPDTLGFFRGQISYLKQAGVTVEAVSSPEAALTEFGKRCGITTHGVPMLRQISPLQDLVALARLWRTLRKIRPDVIHASTPKAALLGLTAGFFAGVPVRIFHVLGLPHVTATGIRRLSLIAGTIASHKLAHRVFCVSASMASMVRNHSRKDKTFVPGFGSVDGVDATHRFHRELVPSAKREEFRRSLGIPSDAPLVLFVGRLVGDKGINELASAWARLQNSWPDAYLVLVGKTEGHDPLPLETVAALEQSPNVRLCGFMEDTPTAYAAADLLVFPTHREGLGYVAIEASAMELPVIACRVPGCTDAVVDGETGTLIPAKDPDAIAESIQRYLRDKDLRKRHGQAGRAHVLQQFPPEPIRQQTYSEYRRLLGRRPAYTVLKRTFDFGAALALLILLSPAILLLAALIRWKIGSPVLFRQRRPGLNGQPFQMYKFRTMTDARDAEGNLLPDSERLTALGKALRSSSLDELPELWNVLTGEMSLVGPRPLLMEYLPRYSPSQNRRHDVKPGITGWAQINGRNALSWDHKFELDVWYVDNRTFLLDLTVLWRTVQTVLSRSGVVHEGHATMPFFLGTEEQV